MERVKRDRAQTINDRSDQPPIMSRQPSSLFASSLRARLGLALVFGAGLFRHKVGTITEALGS